MNPVCTMCGHGETRPGWVGTTHYFGRDYGYRQCCACGSLFCDPMPDGDTLREMYGPAYAVAFADLPGDSDSKQPEKTLAWLSKLGGGTFVDYGCGDGSLLTGARDRGWRAVGVELDGEVAARVGARTGLTVLTDLASLSAGSVDALHLGDVIEHLTDLEHQLPSLLKLVKPGGYLLAQGPLEANANLFTWALRASRLVRRPPPRSEPPYHVLLATARGQRSLFRRHGLDELDFSVSEVAWPAPSRLAVAARGGARSLALYGLRLGSQLLSRLDGKRLGNRYFYVGRRR